MDYRLEHDTWKLKESLYYSVNILEKIQAKIDAYSPQIDRSIGEALVIDDTVMFVAHNKKTGEMTKFDLIDIAKEYDSGHFIGYDYTNMIDIFADDVEVMLIKK